MKTAVFETSLLPDGHLDCPEEFSRMENARYQVIVTFEEPGEAADEGLRPALAEVADGEMLRIEMRIDRLYDEIRELVARSAEDPSLQAEISRKRKKLRTLQEQEADLMEQRADARLRFDPEDGNRLLERAQRLLER